jgi:hypothetical protein
MSAINSIEGLLSGSGPALAKRLERVFDNALRYSFTVRTCRHRTADEEKRRVGLMFDVVEQCMAADQPIHRVMDVMNQLLVMAIDGDEIIIHSGGLWCVQGSSNLEVPIDPKTVHEKLDINAVEEDHIKNPSAEQLLQALEQNERRA